MDAEDSTVPFSNLRASSDRRYRFGNQERSPYNGQNRTLTDHSNPRFYLDGAV
jgi:hypothetical protein